MEVEDWGASCIRKAGWPRKIIEMLINATLTLILTNSYTDPNGTHLRKYRILPIVIPACF